jgi:hypothetical protein
VPLHRAAPDFDLDDLTDGRVDVGCRCTSAALFRSQSLRHNTELRLCFQEECVLCISGGLVRNLTPDERCISSRMHRALNAAGEVTATELRQQLRPGYIADAHSKSPLPELQEKSSGNSELRGLRVAKGGLLDTLADLLHSDPERGAECGPELPEPEPEPELEPHAEMKRQPEPEAKQEEGLKHATNHRSREVESVVIILSEQGQTVETVMKSIQASAIAATAGEHEPIST